ncbi:hypothetical protein BU15DRAFT_62803 [Melanogaster broomeanus]|nr:hypothetical protein BU15DRAFT_62803 [Melanogaster broomeanus]
MTCFQHVGSIFEMEQVVWVKNKRARSKTSGWDEKRIEGEKRAGFDNDQCTDLKDLVATDVSQVPAPPITPKPYVAPEKLYVAPRKDEIDSEWDGGVVRGMGTATADLYPYQLGTRMKTHKWSGEGDQSGPMLYGLAQWRAFHNQQMGPSMRPDQVPGAANPSLLIRASASGGTAPSGGRAPKIAQPTYNNPPSAWTEWFNSGTWQHFMQQSALLLMMPGQYCAIAERFNISIATVGAIGPMQNFGPNSNMIDLANAPLPDNIHRVLQEYELRILSADLATWYVEELPTGMAPALSRVGPALVEAFGTSSGTVVPPGEASSTHEGPIPSPQDQDHDMEGPPAPPVMGTIGPDTGNTSTTSGPLIAEPMIVEPGELIQSVEPGLAQEGEGVKGA